MGRRTKLTPERQKTIVDAIAAGNYIETAAALGGIDKGTLYNWMERGRGQTHGAFFDFLHAVKRAESQAEAVRVARIARAGQEGNWQADAWYLERRYPDRWGRREKHEHTGGGGGEIAVRVHFGRLGPGPTSPDADADAGNPAPGEA